LNLLKKRNENNSYSVIHPGHGSHRLFGLLFRLPRRVSEFQGEKKAADFEKVATLIESGNFQFTVRNASPAGGRTIQITSEYTLEARKGEYEARLPYFGRAYSASYGGDGGIEFKGKPQDFQLARNERKSTLRASFTIDGESDQYQLRLEVGASGFGNLLVSSQKRQNISYYGQVSELEP
jgi:hypothetical protein